jgi:hypothetical protein
VEAVCSTTEQDVLEKIDAIKEEFGDRRWVSPESWDLPKIQEQELWWHAKRTQGRTRQKWGLEEDLSWFTSCPDTAWDAIYLTGLVVRASYYWLNYLACCH